MSATSELLSKYRELSRLRRQALDVESAENAENAAPKSAMAALAKRFPGALRQIDRLPLDLIDARAATLEAVLAGRAEAPAWVAWEDGYHRLLRAALAIKGAVRGVSDAARALPLARLEWEREMSAPFSAELLASIRKPPGGRLNPFVLKTVAANHGISVETLRAALFSDACVDHA